MMKPAGSRSHTQGIKRLSCAHGSTAGSCGRVLDHHHPPAVITSQNALGALSKSLLQRLAPQTG